MPALKDLFRKEIVSIDMTEEQKAALGERLKEIGVKMCIRDSPSTVIIPPNTCCIGVLPGSLHLKPLSIITGKMGVLPAAALI